MLSKTPDAVLETLRKLALALPETAERLSHGGAGLWSASFLALFLLGGPAAAQFPQPRCDVALESPSGGKLEVEIGLAVGQPKLRDLATWHPPSKDSQIDFVVTYWLDASGAVQGLAGASATYRFKASARPPARQVIVEPVGGAEARWAGGTFQSDRMGNYETSAGFRAEDDRALAAQLVSRSGVKITIAENEKPISTATYDLSGKVKRDELVRAAIGLIRSKRALYCKGSTESTPLPLEPIERLPAR